MYAYSSADAFPTNSYQASNYWVDVIFTGSALQPPVANNDSGLIVTENITRSIPASVLLANDTDPNGLPLSITGVSNPSNGTATYNSSTQTISFVPTTGYLGPAGFTYTISDGQGGTASANVALSVVTPLPPVANNDSGFVDITNTALSIPASALLANDTDPNGLPLSITGVSNPSDGTATYNSSTQTISFVPTANYTGPAGFTYTISDGQGAASGQCLAMVNDAGLFSATATPSIATVNDPNPVELGVKFQAATNGSILGIEFYKSPQNTGPHVADLWSSTGACSPPRPSPTKLRAAGNKLTFRTRLPITAGTTYVASYHTDGNYSADRNFFASALTNGPLTAPASATAAAMGSMRTASAAYFPTNTFNATSYSVDVIFRPQLVA